MNPFPCDPVGGSFLPDAFFFSSGRRHTMYIGDWSSDVCSSDLTRGVQTLRRLPTDTAAPNLLITERGLRRLTLRQAPVGWLFRAPRPLTPEQINAARQFALEIGRAHV